MAIFQKTILNQAKQDEVLVAERWSNFQAFKAKADSIRAFKEEEYQEGFLKDIFENCLGYTLKTTNPHSFNLEREKKNETDAKKADGVIVLEGKVAGVIELKDQKTLNLQKIEEQAFNYHNSHESSRYIIISNFNELRFYIDKKTEYEVFYLFNLEYDNFKKLHLLLSYESISKNLPLELKEQSLKHESEVTNKLYKDYRNLRNILFDDLCEKNQNIQKLELLKATQKILDRLVFIFFAEDTGLIPPNSIDKIVKFYKNDWEPKPLYHYYKIYFDAIDKGNERTGIKIGYNGELFKKDDFLDTLEIGDHPLNEFALKISAYDFNSEVGVNILGHIFENSLSELEELKAELENGEFDKKKSKRKKDGVFYTPEYITKYIVEQTLGKLCEEYKKNHKLESKEELDAYRAWLLNLKILDPACGSGAFLNQALEFLIKEHENLNTLYHQIALNNKKKVSLLDFDYQDDYILQNNLYGVDINEEACEIAKLSLWLRTAKQGKKLVSLSEKIKCANSLLDMPFKDGSFDVVIGNPPYVRQEAIKEQKEALSKIYKVFHGSADLYVYFVELGLKLLKPNGNFGYIFPNKWLKTSYAKPLRQFLKNYKIESIIDFGDLQIFDGATTYPLILIISKQEQSEYFRSYQLKELNEDLKTAIKLNGDNISFNTLDDDGWNIFGTKLIQKLNHNAISLHEYTNGEIFYGIKTGFNEAFVIDKNKKDEIAKKDSKSIEIIKPLLRGRDVSKYEINFAEQYLIYTHNKVNIQDYPAVLEHLSLYKSQLEKRAGKQEWWQLQSNGYKDFEKPKLLYMEMQTKNSFCLDNEGSYIVNNKIYVYPQKDNFLLSILNSRITWFLISQFCTQIQNGYQISYDYFKQIPIPKIDKEKQLPFIKLVDEILSLKPKIKDYKKLLEESKNSNNFDREIQLKKEIEKMETKVLESEKEIDLLLYKLYDLSGEEIRIIEENL